MPRAALFILVGTCLLLAGPAAATPITYDFASGTAELEVEVDGNIVVSASAPLVGTFTTFDDMVPAVTDLEWLISDTIDLGSFGTLDIDVSIVDAVGFSGPATPTGPGTWDWSGGAFDVDAMVSLTGGSLGDLGPANFLATVPAATGTISVAGNTATITAAKEVMLSFFHGGKEITISKSVSFMGVPEPSTTVLLAAGVAFLMARSRRRV